MARVDMSDVLRETDRLVQQGKEEIARSTVKVLRNRQRSYWPVDTGLSIKAWLIRSVDERGFTVENPVDYAIFVEARWGLPDQPYPRRPGRSTVEDNIESIVRKVNGRLTN